MKRILTSLLALCLALALGSTAVLAAGGGYVDADGDGLCDHWTGGGPYVDAAGDGLCDHRADRPARGAGRGRHGCCCGGRWA